METALVRPEWLFEVASQAQALALTPLRIRTVEGFCEALDVPQPASAAEEQLLRRFFEGHSSAVLRRLSVEEDRVRSDCSSPRETRVCEAVERAACLLRTDCARSWTVDSLARRVGCNRTDLERGFNARFGRSMHACLADCRTDSAKALLRTKPWRILEIARAVGYQSKVSLYRCFRHTIGATPEEYRARWLLMPVNTRVAELLNLNRHCQI